MDDHASPDWAHSRHGVRRGVVLPRRRIVFIPVPKSGTSSLRWVLADLAGLDREHFRNTTPGAYAKYAIHDLKLWPEHNRWNSLRPRRRERIGHAEGWLRFSVVRDPWRRLWSAWQSKVLLQARTFPERFDDRPWWPGPPAHPDDVVESFRAFVRALADPDTRPLDAHWLPQAAILAAGPPLTHVGRTERLDETYEVLAAHAGLSVADLAVTRRNRTPLAYTAAVYDEASRAIVRDLYRSDLEQFGYPDDPGPDTGLEQWRTQHEDEVARTAEIVAKRIGLKAQRVEP